MGFKVPTVDSFQVDVGSAPSSRYEGVREVAVNSAQASIPSQQMQDVSKGMMSVGNAMAQIGIDAQNEANKVRVIDALTQAKQITQTQLYAKDTGLLNQTGRDAFDRPSGKPLAMEYGDKLTEEFGKLSGTLGNDAQRRLFQQHADDLKLQFSAQADRHEIDQSRKYKNSVYEASVATSVNDISLNIDNPKIVAENITAIKGASLAQARIKGESEEMGMVRAKASISKGILTAIEQAVAKEDVRTASSLMGMYGKEMTADNLVSAQKLTNKLDNKGAIETLTNETLVEIGPRLGGTDMDRALNILRSTESNNEQWGKDGKPLTSESGAVGVGQLMPKTAEAIAKKNGLPWNKELFYANKSGDPAKDQAVRDYNMTISNAFFKELTVTYKGDISKAYASYNAGESVVNKAIKDAEKAGQPQNWQAFMRNYQSEKNFNQTRDYVAKNVKEFLAGATPNQITLEEGIATTVKKAQERGMNQEGIDMAVMDFKTRFTAMKASQAQTQFQATSTALDQLEKNGGNLASLPPFVQNSIPYDKMGEVKAYANALQSGGVKSDPVVVNKLWTSDPRAMSDAEFSTMRMKLSPQDFKMLQDHRTHLNSPSVAKVAGNLPTGQINQSITNSFRSMGLDPTPKDSDKEGQARMAVVRNFIGNSVLAEQRSLGRALNDDEVNKHINGLFAKSVEFKNATLFGMWGQDNTKESILAMGLKGDGTGKYSIPTSDRNEIKKAFKMQNLPEPTDAQIIDTYIRRKMING